MNLNGVRVYADIVALLILNVGVQCASVSVICELARKNPKNYLSLAPTFFKLMTNSTNNWMLIKIIKLVCVCVVCACVMRGVCMCDAWCVHVWCVVCACVMRGVVRPYVCMLCTKLLNPLLSQKILPVTRHFPPTLRHQTFLDSSRGT